MNLFRPGVLPTKATPTILGNTRLRLRPELYLQREVKGQSLLQLEGENFPLYVRELHSVRACNIPTGTALVTLRSLF